MTTSRPESSGTEWDGDLDAVGLAAHFAEYAHRTGAGGGDQRQALAAWLDELIEQEGDEPRP
ncbi:hypothetical protein [Jiangella anatolica]|uniref:Uncharacterized protein n=1 Tax=Jiangella anatolica TaxID=2670374 RepID=A0A2W2B497_9ACTN|nr:hypothetical protein [Jiangella anatolica]PZF80822.1 hypothetical protein C1I92_23950 [Jiangella anatolica]